MINTLFSQNRYSFFNIDIFKEFPSDISSLIEENKIQLRLKKGQILFHEDTIPNGVYILKIGKLKKYTKGLNGKEHIFYLMKENEILGHHTILCDEKYSHSAACLTDCLLYLLPKDFFLSIIKNNNAIAYCFLKNISHEFGVFINNSKILAQYNVRERTALSIIKLHEFFDTNIQLSRKDHSNIVGTSVESLIRVLHDFKEEAIIEINKNIISIINMDKLIKATNFS
ncbi:Crp/Fnr family transcriptional regulator [uncultured Aquimarina sp.]|uniref:Crp/Fnr family transcriptional regulator n=1 Tax=uncultured Aquimarina sp. TaxID=575652 RepID=UPI00261ADE6F|nr:Crp/Fnr family transcriptional regulator [uncultured Aquimarina sp.]